MGADTKIEWADHTFNPWSGCTKVSPACDNCYAEAQEAYRYGRTEWLKNGLRHFMTETTWRKPIRWNKEAEAVGKRRQVFCASLADVFENRDDLIPHRERLWKLIEDTPQLDWLLLTKRPGYIPKLMPEKFPENVWLGTTVESQEYVVRIKQLVRVPAAVYFLSCEPLLGPLDLSEWIYELDWIIAGGETGPRSRPTDPADFRSLRDQANAASVAFHFKQWGDWSPVKPMLSKYYATNMPSGERVYRAGKKLTGRRLDGRTWDEFPDCN